MRNAAQRAGLMFFGCRAGEERCARGELAGAFCRGLGKTLSGAELEVLCELRAGHARLTFDLNFVERE